MAVIRLLSYSCLVLFLLTISFPAARITVSAEDDPEENAPEVPSVQQCRSHIEAALRAFITKKQDEPPQSLPQESLHQEKALPKSNKTTTSFSNFIKNAVQKLQRFLPKILVKMFLTADEQKLQKDAKVKDIVEEPTFKGKEGEEALEKLDKREVPLEAQYETEIKTETEPNKIDESKQDISELSVGEDGLKTGDEESYHGSVHEAVTDDKAFQVEESEIVEEKSNENEDLKSEDKRSQDDEDDKTGTGDEEEEKSIADQDSQAIPPEIQDEDTEKEEETQGKVEQTEETDRETKFENEEETKAEDDDDEETKADDDDDDDDEETEAKVEGGEETEIDETKGEEDEEETKGEEDEEETKGEEDEEETKGEEDEEETKGEEDEEETKGEEDEEETKAEEDEEETKAEEDEEETKAEEREEEETKAEEDEEEETKAEEREEEETKVEEDEEEETKAEEDEDEETKAEEDEEEETKAEEDEEEETKAEEDEEAETKAEEEKEEETTKAEEDEEEETKAEEDEEETKAEEDEEEEETKAEEEEETKAEEDEEEEETKAKEEETKPQEEEEETKADEEEETKAEEEEEETMAEEEETKAEDEERKAEQSEIDEITEVQEGEASGKAETISKSYEESKQEITEGEGDDQDTKTEAADIDADHEDRDASPETEQELSEGDLQADESENGDETQEEDHEEKKEAIESRPHEHIIQILGLDDESMTHTILTEKVIHNTLKELKKMYENAVKPMEGLYKFKDISNRFVGDAELFSKPMILFIGPWSSGKSAMINYLLDIEDTKMALKTGAEPQSNGFTVLMYGENEQLMDGIEVAADWTFSSLQKFGQSFQGRLQGVKLPNNLLRKVTIVDTPGILENRKQQERTYPFNDACQWFIDRADVIYVVFDPAKLDMGLEMEALFDQLKGREAQVRIVLNKADSIKPQELMRVQSTLLWNLSPLLGSTEPPIIFVGTFWSKPYLPESPKTLLNAQEDALLQDLKQTIDGRVENKISFTRRHAVRVRNHAKMVDCYLRTYYNHKTFFSNKKKVADEITENPQNYHIYEGLSTLTNVSRYDLPDPDIYRDFFRVNPLYEFKLLASTCSYFKGCPLDRLDIAIAYDLPELMGKYRKQVGVSSFNERR